MATKVQSTRNIVGMQSIAFIRAITLTLRLTGARPKTPMNVFFDGILVNQYCAKLGSAIGQPLISDSAGAITITFAVPGGKFSTGTKDIVITDASTINSLDVVGSTFGSAKATFTSTGVSQLFQETTTFTQINTIVVEQVLPAPRQTSGGGGGRGQDPLAQSFFTYGIKGGCYLTSIDLFFQSKDNSIPVRLDIRPMINGIPQSFEPQDSKYVCVVNANDVVVIPNSSTAPTNFKFDVPVYLEEDKDYCFVVFSNSKNYNLYTSKLGEKSLETGRIIFEQPYNGSMFKSENNITWQPEQFEDIKFNLNIAKFSTSTNGVVKLKAVSDFFGVSGQYITTTAGNTTIKVKQTIQHGLEVGSKVYVAVDSGAVYNGIIASNISGERTISSIIDEYTYVFNAASSSSTTGEILTGGQLREIQIDNGGTGYTTAPNIELTGGGGTGATATAFISNGSIVRIVVDAKGTGYTTAPNIELTGGGGTGAVLVPIIEAGFSVNANKPTNFIVSNIPAYAAPDAKLSAKIATSQLNYIGGNLNTYSPAEILDMSVRGRTYLNTNAVIASRYNDIARNGGNPTTVVEYSLSTTNENVSPIIDLGNSPSLISYNYRLRGVGTDDLSAITSRGFVQSVTVASGGSGYISTPTISFVGDSTTQATAVAILGTTAISGVTVSAAGTGYTTAPTVSFTGGGGTGATANAILANTGIATINLVNGGSGYTSAPVVSFIGGFVPGQTPATATATVVSGVTNVAITNAGTGYTSAPTVSFTGGGGTGATANAEVDADEHFSNVSVLLHCEGANNSTVVTDSSSTPKAITNAYGNAIIFTDEFKFGTSSAEFTNGEHITSYHATDFKMAGDFTVEAYFRPTYVSPNDSVTPRTLISFFDSTTLRFNIAFDGRNGNISLYTASASNSPILGPLSGGLQHFQWNHLAISRVGTSTKVFVNGILIGETTTSIDLSNITDIFVANQSPHNGFSFYIGYMDDFRLTNNVGRYSSNFSPRATSFPDGVSGGLKSIQIDNGGTGYTTAPTVSFTGGGGTGATATASINGYISSVTINTAGNGYQQVPDVLFTGGGGTGALATATLIPRGLASVSVTAAGTNYTSAPTVSFTGGGGTGATATASIAGRAISEIVVTTSGANYVSVPEVSITRTDGSTGVDAIAFAQLSNVNSELSPTQGNALSRYITKKFTLETPSTGINLFSEIYSEQQSSVDWYIRTSKSGTTQNHDDLEWKILSCDVDRNRSSKRGEVFDYKFYLYGLQEFDVYDLKCVMRSSNPAKAPEVNNYRAIIVA